MKLKITSIGNSAGIILPKEILARLRLEKGDELYVLETPDGIKLTTFDPTLAEQMEVADRVMRKRRALLHKLAQLGRGHACLDQPSPDFAHSRPSAGRARWRQRRAVLRVARLRPGATAAIVCLRSPAPGSR